MAKARDGEYWKLDNHVYEIIEEAGTDPKKDHESCLIKLVGRLNSFGNTLLFENVARRAINTSGHSIGLKGNWVKLTDEEIISYGLSAKEIDPKDKVLIKIKLPSFKNLKNG